MSSSAVFVSENDKLLRNAPNLFERIFFSVRKKCFRPWNVYKRRHVCGDNFEMKGSSSKALLLICSYCSVFHLLAQEMEGAKD